MTTVDQAVAAARQLGQMAGRLGHPSTSCPYPRDGKVPARRAARMAWLQEYRKLRPSPPPPTALMSDLQAVADGDDDGNGLVDGRRLTARPAGLPDFRIP